MNVSLDGTRHQPSHDWDEIELRNERARDLPRYVVFGALLALAAYVAWSYLSA